MKNAKLLVALVLFTSCTCSEVDVVPLSPIVITVDAPMVGLTMTQALMPGSQLVRFKLVNTASERSAVGKILVKDSHKTLNDGVMYQFWYSDQNSTNFMANKLGEPSELAPTDILIIEGGSCRYVTVTIADLGRAVHGDGFQLSLIGYTWQAEGEQHDEVLPQPLTGGTLVKQ